MNYDFSSHQHKKHEYFDPYEILEIPRDADLEMIRQSFRKMTRIYHPDRNRNNPQYDQQHYSRICAAYEILSDPRQRASFDQQFAPTWDVLREGSKKYYQQPAAPQQQQQSSSTQVQQKGRFTSSDLGQFNSSFERQRKSTANDRGYGDQMIGRLTEQEVKSGRKMESPSNLFGGATSVNAGTFNSKFDSEIKQRRNQNNNKSMMEYSDEPLGWSSGGISSGFSDISVYDGFMVDCEKNDFSKTDEATGLNYSDYVSGFNTFTEQLPENHHYYDAKGKDIERIYNERVAQLKQMPERKNNISFAQAGEYFDQQKEKAMLAEQQRNRELVLKYRDQYSSDDLLPPSSNNNNNNIRNIAKKKDDNTSINNRILDRQFNRLY